MKKVLFAIVLGMSIMSVNAQDTFQKGTKLLSASIGFNSNGLPIAVSYEVGVKDNLFNVDKLNLGIGGYIGVYGYNKSVSLFGGTSETSFLILSPGVRALLHYQIIDKLDAYAGPSLGISFQHSSVSASGMQARTANDVLFAWGFIGGLRYEITPQWGVFAEGGKASGNLTLGVAYKF